MVWYFPLIRMKNNCWIFKAHVCKLFDFSSLAFLGCQMKPCRLISMYKIENDEVFSFSRIFSGSKYIFPLKGFNELYFKKLTNWYNNLLIWLTIIVRNFKSNGLVSSTESNIKEVESLVAVYCRYLTLLDFARVFLW